MKKNSFFMGIPALLLVFGLALSACGDDPGGGGTDGDGTEQLPAASGVNALGGKKYFENHEKTTFAATADGAQSGTYTVSYVANGTYNASEKFMYTDIETGTYTWNAEAKTVSLKPEKVAISEGRSDSMPSPDGQIEIENGYGPLQDKAEYRAALQTQLNEIKQEMGEAAFNEALASEGFSSVSAYLDYAIAEWFGNRTNNYAFSTDNAALFLDEVLPANKGTNELTGKEFTGQNDSRKKVVFTATTYSETSSDTEIETGEYRYDAEWKLVYLKPLTREGKTVAQYYDSLGSISAGHYESDVAAKASETNNRFRMGSSNYKLSPNVIY